MSSTNLYDYQKKCISWMQERSYGYLAVDMGLGKTRCVIEYCKASRGPYELPSLVVAPLRVMLNTWPTEIEKWWPKCKYVILHGTQKAKALTKPADIYLINYEGLPWLLKSGASLKFYNLILDEATKIKSHNSQTTKFAIQLGAKVHTRWCLSATPFPQGLVDAWSQFRFLDGGKKLESKWSQFTKKYCSHDRFYQYRVMPLVEKAIVDTIKTDMFRLDAADYITLPGVIDDNRLFSLPAPLREEYDKMHKTMMLELGTTTIPLISAGSQLSVMRQWLSGRVYNADKTSYTEVHTLKLDILDDILEEIHGEPAIVVIAFTHELMALKKKYGEDLPHLTGAASSRQSLVWIEQWKAKKIPLMVVHPAAAALGLNLQDGGNHIIWLSLTYNYEHYFQLIGRLHRQGQTKPVVNHRILAKNTIDKAVAKCLEQKEMNLELTLTSL